MESGRGDEPVLLVHGYGDTGATPWWRTLERRFLARGYPDDAVETLSFGAPGLTLGSPRRYARHIGERVEALRDEYDSRVDIVAHSMGGLGARWYVERAGGAAFVDDLVTLGTPHQGATLAFTQPTPGGRDMTPDSSFLRTLNGRRPPRGVTYTAVGSEADSLVAPDRAALPFEARNVTNVRVSGPGHMGLVSDAAVFDRYAGAL
ncbi:lipase family alpha/beta hydrolase [Halomarina oriensis]|uniref:Alpha/beta fold hydrolase n=1 Tax=Halomarina oriensis TaxID=671145 RepID=A0A6B0GKV4_9EURY|nr:alpha/beta fold hydrolase [Halomarina oriensis]MWG35250.1 alpha/beta fold hydrolase [Halomarina oriensis]